QRRLDTGHLRRRVPSADARRRGQDLRPRRAGHPLGAVQLRVVQQLPPVDRVEPATLLGVRTLVLAGGLGARQGYEQADPGQRSRRGKQEAAREARLSTPQVEVTMTRPVSDYLAGGEPDQRELPVGGVASIE